MSNDEKRLAALEFHMELLVKQMDPKKYPLDYLIIEKNLQGRTLMKYTKLVKS